MNKKSTIIAITISFILVIGVVVLFAGLKNYVKKIHVQSVEFDIAGTPYGDGTFDVGGDNPVTSYQLQWKVLPYDAENKNVTFSSSNNLITVNEDGLVSFTQPNLFATITITTEDQSKTDTISIITKTSDPQTLNYNFETNTLTEPEDKTYLVRTKDGVQTLILFKGSNYEYEVLEGFTISEKTNSDLLSIGDKDTDNKYSFSANTTGATEIVVNSGEETKNIKVQIVERVLSIEIAHYLKNGQGKYVYGSANAFNLPITVGTTSGSKMGDLEYEVKNSKGEIVNPTIIGMNANFAGLTDDVYTIRVRAKYDPSVTASVTFTLNAGYNVASHSDMLTYFNDNTKTRINLVADIILKPEDFADILVDVEGTKFMPISKAHAEKRSIYHRTTGVRFNGNNHLIDAGLVPIEAEFVNGIGHDRTSIFMLGNNNLDNGSSTKAPSKYFSDARSVTYPQSTIRQLLVENQNLVLGEEDAATQRAYVKSLYNSCEKFIISNLNIEGNSLSDKGLKITDKNNVTNYTGYRTFHGISVNDVDVTLDNVHIKECMMGINQGDVYNGSFRTVIKNCSVQDTFAYNVYVARTASFIIENCDFADAGHCAVYAKAWDADQYIDRITTINDNEGIALGVKFIGDVNFDNWIDVDEATPMLQTTGEKALLAGVNATIVQILGTNASLLVKEEGGHQYINYAFQSECVSTSEPVLTKIDVTALYDYREEFGTTSNNATINNVFGNPTGKDIYWSTLALASQGVFGAETLSIAYDLITKYCYCTKDIVCCSLNVAQLPGGSGYNATSYFYLGANVQAN